MSLRGSFLDVTSLGLVPIVLLFALPFNSVQILSHPPLNQDIPLISSTFQEGLNFLHCPFSHWLLATGNRSEPASSTLYGLVASVKTLSRISYLVNAKLFKY